MQCLDFERFWNERLDARESVPPALEQALEAHAAVCPACRQVALRYQTLQQVLRTVACPPAPPADLLPRVLQAWDLDRISVRRKVRIQRMMGPLALAASLILTAVLGWRWLPGDPRPRPQAPVEPSHRAGKELPPLLTDALATAGSATWNLALESSAPAARIGLEFLDAATLREAAPIPTTPGLALSLPDAQSDVFQSVGERVNAQVLPLSGTARHAFGFLLGAPVDQGTAPTNPSESG